MKTTATTPATRVNFAQAVDSIEAVGTTNTILLRGQPGIGKSSILKALAARMPDYLPCYIDCANLDLGDLGMPMVDRERRITEYAPNARFGITPGQTRPVLIMLDEITKAVRPVLNMLMPLMQERRLVDAGVPLGSIICATGNLATDAVGDNFPAHGYDRVTELDLGNPTSEEWLDWANDAGIAPEVCMFAREHPEIFERYDEIDNPKANPYIFNPLTGNIRKFCTPRGLEKASNIIKARARVGSALRPLLAGTIGEAAANMMQASIAMGDRIPPTDAILQDPQGTAVPTDMASQFFLAYKLSGQLRTVTQLEAGNAYVLRWPSAEARVLYSRRIAGSQKVAPMAMQTTNFRLLSADAGKYY